MYTFQLHLEETYNKHIIRGLVKAEIMATAVFTNMFVNATIAIEEYMSKAYYTSKNNRITMLKKYDVEDIAIQLFMCVLPINNGHRTVEPIQGIATELGLQFYSNQLEAVKTGAELLAICESCGLYTILSSFSEEHMHDTAVIKPNYMLEEDTLRAIHTTMFMPPMLCEPLPWKDNDNGGFLLSNSSCVLGSGNDVEQHQALDVLNKLQSIKWTLNETMLLEEELPSKPLDMNNPSDIRKAKQHSDRCIQSQFIYDLMLKENNEFYFIWKYDKRGRIYSQGYDINLQGSEYKKSIIEFAHKELVTL